MAALLFIDINDLMTDFAKENDLHEWSILVASYEIVGSLKQRSNYYGITNGVKCESKYDNIEFVTSIRPTPTIMEHCNSQQMETFIEMYTSHLLGAEPYVDLCSIVDMILTNDYKVMIVMAEYEMKSKIPMVLNEFIKDEFGVNGYIYKDLLRLSDHYGTPMYEKIVESSDFYVPETFTGKNYNVILSNVADNIEEAKKILEAQKIVASDMMAKPGEENDLQSIFFNKFTESLEETIEQLLRKKDIETIKELCRRKHIRINPNYSKEFLIDKLMHQMKKDSTRIVEYESM